jgi:hypothetical protein
MKAALVGSSGGSKLYYILDASVDEMDGAIEKDDGTVIMVDFQSHVSRARKIKRIKTTPFHKVFWDGDDGDNQEAWEIIFIQKSKEIPKEVLVGVSVQTSLGRNKRNISQKNETALRFNKSLERASSKSCCDGQVVKSIERKSLRFSSAEERKSTWTAMSILREIEE